MKINQLKPYLITLIILWTIAVGAFAFNQIKEAFDKAKVYDARVEHIDTVTEIERERFRLEREE